MYDSYVSACGITIARAWEGDPNAQQNHKLR